MEVMYNNLIIHNNLMKHGKVIIFEETKTIHIKKYLWENGYNVIELKFINEILKILDINYFDDKGMIKKQFENIQFDYLKYIIKQQVFKLSLYRGLNVAIEIPKASRDIFINYQIFDHVKYFSHNISYTTNKNEKTKKEVKIVLFCGASRTGKTTSSLILQQKGYHLIQSDTFMYPIIVGLLDKNKKNDRKILNKIFDFYISYAHNLIKYINKATVIDEPYINLEHIVKYKNQINVFCFGLIEQDVNKIIANFKEYDRNISNWTFSLSDENLLEIATKIMEESKILKKKCEELDLIFINTKYGIKRDNILNNVTSKINDDI